MPPDWEPPTPNYPQYLSTFYQQDQPLEADPAPSDDNFTDVSDTRSLRDSIYNYIVENGRTYHSYRAGAYVLPNDEIENERLDWLHYLFYILFGQRNFFAPIQDTPMKKVLDLGTGTGKWAIELAKTFPHTHVIGTDLSPIQPTTDLPNNVHFLVDDATETEWGNSKYDYIHARMMLGCFEDYKSIIKRAFDNLQPGGYMESQEVYNVLFCADGTMKPGNAFLDWTRTQDEAAMKLGRPLRIANKLKRWYEECGFVDVQEEVFQLPINGWPKDPRFKFIGKFWEKSFIDGLQGFSLATFHRAFGWTREEIEAYLVPVRVAISDRSVHAYHKCYVVWGRKPLPGETAANVQKTRRAPLLVPQPPQPPPSSSRNWFGKR